MSAQENKTVAILGVPLGYGASMAGVDMGPAALRVARLQQRIERLGYPVRDLGDMRLERPQTSPLAGDKLKYVREISVACEQLAKEVEEILQAAQLPLVLGGDHSIAIGSFAGAASYFKQREETLGLIWFDAHADINTPETTPSGNIHGMPLAVLLGYGTPELTNVAGFAPKLNPRLCVHVGARDIDLAERDLIAKTGLRFITMREIDERGMSACMDDDLEPDDTFAQATYAEVYPDPYVNMDRMICGGDDDWYEIALYTGETIAVDLDFTQSSPDEDLDLHFHDDGGVDLTPCDEDSPGTCTDAQGQGTNSDEHYEFTVDEAGCSPCTYYVRVHGWDGAENSYGLTLTLQ